MPAGTDNMGVESAKEYIPGSRTPGECGSRSGSTTDERSLQLDAKPLVVQQVMGPVQIDLFSSRLMKQLPTFQS